MESVSLRRLGVARDLIGSNRSNWLKAGPDHRLCWISVRADCSPIADSIRKSRRKLQNTEAANSTQRPIEKMRQVGVTFWLHLTEAAITPSGCSAKRSWHRGNPTTHGHSVSVVSFFTDRELRHEMFSSDLLHGEKGVRSFPLRKTHPCCGHFRDTLI